MRRAALLLTLGLAGCGGASAPVVHTLTFTRPQTTPAPASRVPANTGQCPVDPTSPRWHSGPCVVLLYKQCTATPVEAVERSIERTACRVLEADGKAGGLTGR